MPTMKRMRNGRKKSTRRRKRGATRGAIGGGAIHQHCKFTRGYITGSVAYTPYQGALAVTLANLAGYAELTALYDQYRIDKLEVTFTLNMDPGAQAASSAIYPKLWWSEDYDDSGTVTQAQMQERSNAVMRVLTPHDPVVFTVRPAVLVQTYKTLTTSGYSPKQGLWIDNQDTSVPHYGAQYNIEDLTNTNYTVNVTTKAWVSCRNSI